MVGGDLGVAVLSQAEKPESQKRNYRSQNVKAGSTLFQQFPILFPAEKPILSPSANTTLGKDPTFERGRGRTVRLETEREGPSLCHCNSLELQGYKERCLETTR